MSESFLDLVQKERERLQKEREELKKLGDFADALDEHAAHREFVKDVLSQGKQQEEGSGKGKGEAEAGTP